MSWISQHKLIFIIIIMLIVVGVWFGLSQGGAPAAVLTTTSASGAPTSAKSSVADQELVGTLLTLRAVTLAGTIFSEPAFSSLQDYGTTIVPEPVGRLNPFAPLTSGGATTSDSQHAAQIFAPKR